MSIVTTKRKRRDCFLTVYFLEVYPMGALTCSVGACWRLSDSGKGAKEAGAGRPSSPQFPPVVFFLSALSQFCGPDYLGAWNRLVVLQRGVG